MELKSEASYGVSLFLIRKQRLVPLKHEPFEIGLLVLRFDCRTLVVHFCLQPCG